MSSLDTADMFRRMDAQEDRRLAAIVVADVVGYSRLMSTDEIGTIRAVNELRQTILEPLLSEFGGRMVKTMGDGFLMEFHSVVAAVKASQQSQTRLTDRYKDTPEEQRIRLRIGIHIGDVVVQEGDLFGDGVNTAARIEPLAPVGGVAVSDDAHRQVRDRLDIFWTNTGEHNLKNIARPIRIWQWVEGSVQDQIEPESSVFSEKPAVAVLPFDNMSSDADQEYFSDGLTEDITTALARWRSFPVIARNSSFAYKNKNVDSKTASSALGARYLVKGSVRKSGERVRVSAQLIDGANGHHIWADKFDRELSDIFDVQDEIVQRVAAIVAPELARVEIDRSTGKRPDDLGAWDLFLRGMGQLRKGNRKSFSRARQLFNRAIGLQNDYTDAYNGLAMSYNQELLLDAEGDREATAILAKKTALQAIEYDESSAWAHHELSTAYQWLNCIEDALAEARISVQLNPYDAYGLHALGNKSDLAGDPSGIGYMERAQKLNPIDTSQPVHMAFLARAYVNAGQYDRAVERAREAIRRRSEYAPAYYVLAVALGHLNKLEEAHTALATCEKLSPGFVKSRLNWQPYADTESNIRLHSGLRNVDLPTESS